MAQLVIPIVFGPAAAQLVGMYHPPDPHVALGAGVVLCNPLGYEAMCVHRTYRHLARRLSAAGFDVLRFDYHGTGDSSGHRDEPDRLRAWLDGIGAAVEELRTTTGVMAVDLVGVRIGATLAMLAAGERRDIRSLVLWGPVVSGRTFVREARALQGLQDRGGPGAERVRDVREVVDPGDLSIRELAGVSLLAQRERCAERALVLPRDDLPTGESQLTAHLRECGVETDLRTERGYARMMDHPETAEVPFATLDVIVAWLRRPGATIAPRRPLDRAPPKILSAWSRAPRRPVREEALSFGEGNRLFGILTEDAALNGGRTAVIFLNAGANHRVGPNRLHVSLARDLAARGYPSLRLDAGGIGDGLPASGAAENRIYSKDSVSDVEAAMTLLTNIRGVDRFLLVGICSGGFLAFHTSADDRRVAGQILINPQTFEWRSGDPLTLSTRRGFKSTRYYLRALRSPSVWTLAMRGALDLRGVAGALRRRFAAQIVARLKDTMAAWRGLASARTEVEQAFRVLSDRGVRSLLVFSSNDGGLDMIEYHLGTGARRMREQANLRLEVVEGADHTFTGKEAQERLHGLVTQFVETFPASAPGPSPTVLGRDLRTVTAT